jgi:hypothetical protein
MFNLGLFIMNLLEMGTRLSRETSRKMFQSKLTSHGADDKFLTNHWNKKKKTRQKNIPQLLFLVEEGT